MLTQSELEDIKKKLRTFYNNNMLYCVKHDYEEKEKLIQGDPALQHILSNLDQNKSVLDVGSSSGAITFEIAKLAGETTGIDISDKACKYANYNKKVEAKRLQLMEDISKLDYKSHQVAQVELLPMDIEKPTLTDKKFDLVIGRYVIEYTILPVKALDEMYNLTKRRGKILLAIQIIESNNLDLENLTLEQGEEVAPPIVYSISYHLLKTWAKQKKLTLHKLIIDYDSKFLNTFVTIFPFVKGRKSFTKHEKHIYVEYIKE